MAQAFKEQSTEKRAVLEWSQSAVSAPLNSISFVARHYCVPASRIVYTKQHLFNQLELEWHEATLYSSSLTEIIAHPSYQRIIGMGRDALPFILAALRRESDHWHWALFSITGANPVPPEASGDLEKTRDAWLNWAASRPEILDHG